MGSEGGAACVSGADNEVWSFGEEAYEICRKYLALREQMKPYITRMMKKAHEKGTPPMRPLFYDFPEDGLCWEIENEYLFGDELLIAPVLYEKQRQREVYLPKGTKWTDIRTKEKYEGGQTILAEAPLDALPVYCRAGKACRSEA